MLMEGGVFSSRVVSTWRNFGLSSAGLDVDQVGAQNCIPSSITGTISSVSGHDRLEPWPNSFACTDRFEFKQKKLENGVILHTIGSIENAVRKDEHLASDGKIHGNSCLDPAIFDKKSVKILPKQNNCVHKQKRVGNSVTLLPEHTQRTWGKESFHDSQFGFSRLSQLERNENLLETQVICKKCDKMSIYAFETRYRENNENFSETQVNFKIHDKSPLTVSQTICSEENGNIFSETGVPYKGHYKMHIADYQTGNSKIVLWPGNKVINSDSNKVSMVEQNETCLRTLMNCRVPGRKIIASSPSRFSSCFSNSGEKDRKNESVIEANCKSRSASKDCAGFKNQGGTSLGKFTSKLEQIMHTNKGEMTVLECVSSGVGATRVAEGDLEKEWCITVLKKYGLLDVPPQGPAATDHPGVVGDGSCKKECKLCGFLEDSTGTLICDMCEESFHVTCCPGVNSIPFEDDWYCSTCRRKRKRPVSKSFLETIDNEDRLKSQIAVQGKASEDKNALFWCMLQDDEAYTTKVRIGKEYQADVPDWTSKITDSPENPFMGKVISTEGLLPEEELAKQNLKNDVWAEDWEPPKYPPPRPNENSLQRQNVRYIKGEACPDGRKARKDISWGKWRSCPYNRWYGSTQLPHSQPYRPVTLYGRPGRLYNRPAKPYDQPATLHGPRGGPCGQLA